MFSSCRERFSRFCSGVVVEDLSVPLTTTIVASLEIPGCGAEVLVAFVDFTPPHASSGVYLTSSKVRNQRRSEVPTG